MKSEPEVSSVVGTGGGVVVGTDVGRGVGTDVGGVVGMDVGVVVSTDGGRVVSGVNVTVSRAGSCTITLVSGVSGVASVESKPVHPVRKTMPVTRTRKIPTASHVVKARAVKIPEI